MNDFYDADLAVQLKARVRQDEPPLGINLRDIELAARRQSRLRLGLGAAAGAVAVGLTATLGGLVLNAGSTVTYPPLSCLDDLPTRPPLTPPPSELMAAEQPKHIPGPLPTNTDFLDPVTDVNPSAVYDPHPPASGPEAVALACHVSGAVRALFPEARFADLDYGSGPAPFRPTGRGFGDPRGVTSGATVVTANEVGTIEVGVAPFSVRPEPDRCRHDGAPCTTRVGPHREEIEVYEAQGYVTVYVYSGHTVITLTRYRLPLTADQLVTLGTDPALALFG